MYFIFNESIVLTSPSVALTTTNVMTVAWTIALMIATERIATVMIAMTATAKTGLHTVAKGHDPPAAVNSKNVAPGRPLPGGNLMIGDLQGTMIGGEAMMTVEALTLIMIAAGTTTDVGTTDGAMRRMNGLMIGQPPDMQPRMEKVDGVKIQDGTQVVRSI
jgi:hypothetical protein